MVVVGQAEARHCLGANEDEKNCTVATGGSLSVGLVGLLRGLIGL